jgi:rRNA maturation endonuclease Nob1
VSANSVEEDVVSYSLVCKDCKHKFQLECEHLLQKEDRVCSECGSTRVRQRLVGIIRNLDVAAYDGEKLIPKKC